MNDRSGEPRAAIEPQRAGVQAPLEVPRTALLAGATGLVGSALLGLLRASPRYGRVHVLLRRAVPVIAADERISLLLVDFDRLPEPLPPVDDVFIALGTTIKAAGSQAAFRRVDFDAVLATGRAARAAGARRLGVVSALGADAASRVFYNRVKGEMQDAVVQLGFESVVIVQPSLLLGDRAALGQPTRAGEVLAAELLGPLMRVVPQRVRPIPAATVAEALLAAVLDGTSGVQRLCSAELWRRAGSTGREATPIGTGRR